MGTSEQASSFANVESRFSAALERIEHAQMAVQKKEELVHMERKEVEKERLQNQVQSLVRDNLKLQVRKVDLINPFPMAWQLIQLNPDSARISPKWKCGSNPDCFYIDTFTSTWEISKNSVCKCMQRY